MDHVPAPVVLPIALTLSQVRPVAYRVISKKHGLNLKSAALEVLANFLGRQFGAEWRGARAERCLDELAKLWKEEDRGLFVDGEPLKQIIKTWQNAQLANNLAREPTILAPDSAGTEGTVVESITEFRPPRKFQWKQYFRVVDSHKQQRFIYNHIKKHYEIANPSEPRAIAPPQSLVELFPNRYYVLYDRVYRNNMFQSAAYSNTKEFYTITQLKTLIGRPIGTEFFVFGLLNRIDASEGPLDGWTISDMSSRMPLMFTEHTSYAPDHYYTNGSFVLCHGLYMGDYFQVGTLGPPPIERREDTRKALGQLDFFANSSRIERTDPNLQNVFEREEERLNHKIVVLGGDVFLDKQNVRDALKRLFAHLDEEPPVALVIPGSFVSIPFQPQTGPDSEGGTASYRDALNALAELFQENHRLSATKVILVPGENDPWHAAYCAGGQSPAWPLLPIPDIFTGRVDRALPSIEWASNPTRLLYLSHEIVIAREDYGTRLRQNSLEIPSSPTQELVDLSIHEFGSDSDTDDDERLARVQAFKAQRNEKPIKTSREIATDSHEARKVTATLLDQCHLSPFPLSVRPITWENDHALSLAQWPTELVLIDPSTPQFKQVYEGCHVMNPGPFLKGGKAQWLEYWPASGQFSFESL